MEDIKLVKQTEFKDLKLSGNSPEGPKIKIKNKTLEEEEPI